MATSLSFDPHTVDHAAEAVRLLAMVADATYHKGTGLYGHAPEVVAQVLAMAQVHATLAVAGRAS
jgi:hypothetical protein